MANVTRARSPFGSSHNGDEGVQTGVRGSLAPPFIRINQGLRGLRMEIGIDSFAAILPDPVTGAVPSATNRMAELLDEIETAERVGLDVFGIGEHHRAEFLDSAPAVILAAAAARTSRIRLTSAVTVLSAADPVRVFQEFATLDLISKGRAEIIAGRGSSVEAFPLFGMPMDAYDDLFAEKLDLLLKLRESTTITWEGRFRPALNGQGVFPRPHQARLPLWVGVGGTPQSFERAGRLGLPLMVAIIGGTFDRFRPLVDLYRRAGERAGHDPATLMVGVHAMGFVGNTDDEARDAFFPGWAYLMGKIGRERGWPPPSRAQFDDMASPEGAYLIGGPATVAAKMRHASDVLGGVSRIIFQKSTASLETAAMKRSIELLGTEVAPIIQAGRSNP
jgi:probable LLM family oxidoreductase